MRAALVISDNGIKIAKMVGNKPLLANIPLDQGIIDDGQVKDEDKLKAVFLKIARQFSLAQSEVILGVSEKYIFSKTITVSDHGSDLEEKISHEIESYSPADGNTYLDWQILEKTENQETVFVVSARGNILDKSTAILKAAGIFIAGIEPVSFALARHLPKQPPPTAKTADKEGGEKAETPSQTSKGQAALIVDLEENETILVIANKKGKIELTSVLPKEASAANELTNEIGNMRAFYEKRDGKDETAKIGRVYITGAAAENIREQIAVNLSTTVDFLSISYPVAKREEALSFFPVFALLDLPLTFPKNHQHVNLLPADLSRLVDKKLKIAKRVHFARLATAFFGALCLFYLAGLVFLLWNMFSLQDQIARQQEAMKKENSVKVREQVKELNREIAAVKKFRENKTSLLETLSFIADKSPGGLSITHYTYNVAQNSWTISGKSLERDQLLGFGQTLETEGKFTKVNIPLISLEKKGSANFSLSFEGSKK
ncbi:pilus assembly protein PilM [Candidatus Microgenomates bacterium]|nr:pilus assembly protein PilM [Candidatus Microgenomates bacterium]